MYSNLVYCGTVRLPSLALIISEMQTFEMTVMFYN
jgi:hypothetical protein